ncbi:unnamed protein product [Microthlaspi erraticum]|uniref:TRF2/HOY1 PH-like domain-containing protein n=1 Tax=Microthlaspi erraticum TaxID=1685480 RepID=A0A6D2HRY7_9BRAS|nr:unnamed protein product [Microthlaspi erraticum]
MDLRIGPKAILQEMLYRIERMEKTLHRNTAASNPPAKQKSPCGIMDDEDSIPPLNLPLTKTPEFLAKIQAILNEYYPCPHQQTLPHVTEDTTTLTLPESYKSSEKPKALNFPVSKITVGQWTHTAVYPDDLKAKFYFAKRKLMWEILDNVEQVPRLKRKMEIHWADVLSLKTTFHSDNETGTLEVELGRRPTFFVETNLQAGKQTKWIKMDQDFTLNQSASKFRRHTLDFAPGVLQKNFEKLVSSHSFWSELIKVPFPVSPPSFEIGDGHSQTLSSNVNDDLLRYARGLEHEPYGEMYLNMATQFCANDGRPMNAFAQVNRQNETMNQLPGTQVIQPSSQLINRGSYVSGSLFNNPTSQMINAGVLRGGQALPDTRINSSMVNQHMNQVPSTHRAGPYPQPQGYFVQGETQNMNHTHNGYGQHVNEVPSIHRAGPDLGGYSVQGEPQNMNHTQHGCGQNFSNKDGSVPPDF